MLRELYTFTLLCNVLTFCNSEDSTEWYFGLRSFLMECITIPRNETGRDIFETFPKCIQHHMLTVLDSVLVDDVIPVINGINLVRYQGNAYNLTDDKWQDENVTHDSLKNITTWSNMAFQRLMRVLHSHVLKIDIDYLANYIGFGVNHPVSDASSNINHARRRRHKRRHHMMPLMMMGLLLMGSVLIPMGFQFLAVLGGKALLLAKMALILSSIQGLKKIATNGVNYGLYHAPVSETWHDRSSQETQMHPFRTHVRDNHFAYPTP